MFSVARNIRLSEGDSVLDGIIVLRDSVLPYVSASRTESEQFVAISTIFRYAFNAIMQRLHTDSETLGSTMYATYLKKNHDYGNAWEQELGVFGVIVMHIRAFEKLNRVVILMRDPQSQQVNDESITDTLSDICNYCVMTCMWLRTYHTDHDLTQS